MDYYIDGYNLLFRLSKTTASLESKRKNLIVQISEIIDSLGLSATIVFDGAEEHLPYTTRQLLGSLEIIYTSKGQTADHYLLDISERRGKQQLTIVTSDRTLAKHCRLLGADTKTIEAFLLFLRKRVDEEITKTPKTKQKRPSKEIERYLRIFEERLVE